MIGFGIAFADRAMGLGGSNMVTEGSQGIGGDSRTTWMGNRAAVCVAHRVTRKTEEEPRREAAGKPRAPFWTAPPVNSAEALQRTPRVISFPRFADEGTKAPRAYVTQPRPCG